jgi:hypothetical protein
LRSGKCIAIVNILQDSILYHLSGDTRGAPKKGGGRWGRGDLLKASLNVGGIVSPRHSLHEDV